MFHIGSLIRQLRKEQKLTQGELGQGIVSKAEVSKIEAGICFPNIFVLGALMQRLGKTLAPFEIIVTRQEYEKLVKGSYAVSLQTTVIQESDFIKDLREGRGLSQEQFGFDVFARETISKIENGRASRHRKRLKLMAQLGEPVENYYGYVVAKEYEVYELAEKFRKIIGENSEEEKKLRLELEQRLDISEAVNRQFLESSELLIKGKNGELSHGEVLAGLEQCLRYTMPEYDGIIYRIPFRQEVVILKEIITYMNYVNRIEAGRLLAQKLEEKIGKKLKVS